MKRLIRWLCWWKKNPDIDPFATAGYVAGQVRQKSLAELQEEWKNCPTCQGEGFCSIHDSVGIETLKNNKDGSDNVAIGKTLFGKPINLQDIIYGKGTG